MLVAVRRLPYLSADQAEITRATNKLLDRQLLIMESTFDGVTALRASFRSVEESSKRHVQALSQLETCHRNVLLEYQAMLIRAHRRLGWLAVLGVLLAAGALAAVAYVGWRVLLP
jgi:ferric-dicitrate binding protein FerR (iron transport regulator)